MWLAQNFGLQAGQRRRIKRPVPLAGPVRQHIRETLNAVGLIAFTFEGETGLALAHRHPYR